MDEVMDILKRPLFTVNGISLTVGALLVIVALAWAYSKRK